MINGVIVQKDINCDYKGVEGDNWYLNDLYPDVFKTDFENQIEKAWYDNNFVDVCGFDSFLKPYVKLSQENNIPFRILLCETEKKQPICEMDFGEKIFGSPPILVDRSI